MVNKNTVYHISIFGPDSVSFKFIDSYNNLLNDSRKKKNALPLVQQCVEKLNTQIGN